MTEKVNYYKELELDKNASSEALEQELKVIIEKWFNILNTSKQEERTEAEYMIKITEEAIEILGNPDKKEEYDREITTLPAKDDLSEYEHIYNKAQEIKDLGKLNETMTLAKQLLDMNPNDWRGWEIAGRVYHDDNKKEIALNYYEKAIELEKNIPAYVYCNLGIAQKVLGKYVEAFINLQHSLDISPNFDRSLEECKNLLTYMDIDSVLPFFEELKEKRNDSLAYETLAKAYVLKAEGLVQTIDGSPSFTSEEQKKEYTALFRKAKNLSGKPEYAKKISEAEYALVEDEYEQKYNKTKNFIELGNLDEAMILAEQLVDMNPNDWRGWEITGRVYHNHNKEIAQNYYIKAIELEKNLPAFVYCNLGIAQRVLGKYVEAFKNFQCSLAISCNLNRPLEECKKLLQYMDLDSMLPFLEDLKEKRNDKLAYDTLATAYSLKAEELVQEIDGILCFTSEEQIQEYKKRLKKAASYGEIPDLDKKIAEADSMLEKTLDKQKIPVLIIGLLRMLIYLYELHIFFTPLALVILTVITYKSYRPKYEINRLKVGTESVYDELIDKTFIKDSIARTIIIWIVFANIMTVPYIGIVVYSVLTIYIIFSSIYTGVIDKKIKNKLNSEDNYGLIFNGELESERRRRIRKIEWSRWWEKWGPTVWKVTKIIGILALVAIVGYILFWIVLIGIVMMAVGAGMSDSGEQTTRQIDQNARERRLWEEDQMRNNSRRR